ncbi:MAG: hypothetical protein GFH27_549283n392 [Chloroflexi bacterium AL-W]|nr:hypothetical protein [Chloroflexi bacterium AL-N1]NOK64486.1 hypothetical protein [Chloroflexi bacterium AL-N10]NOK75728.1 hypothetical protein [Chloroflexi bacterium AL-N5]NOK80513.1 hypothetical protein [Chloroflexi bacterium AL-W]NOK87027.1 hypothetical protein [Chloroflexi bacterium AL-N15]
MTIRRTSATYLGRYHNRQDAELTHDLRYRYQQALSTPTLDCADLYELLRADRREALLKLADLTLPQLTLQAYAFAGYVNERHGKEWTGLEMLQWWNDQIAQMEGA